MHIKFHRTGLSIALVIALDFKIHKINHNLVTNYQNFMKLKLNMYQYNMAIYIKFHQNVCIEYELLSLNVFKIVKFSPY